MSSTTKVSQSKSLMCLQRLVWFTFVIAILVLLFCLAAITAIMSIRPPCTISGTVCADGWSVAGLAAVILGVGGTMLTVISGLAVAAWWIDLEKKVETKIEEKFDDIFKNLIEEHLKPVKENIKNHQDILDKLSMKQETSDKELKFVFRQFEGGLQFAIYCAFPKHMKLEGFDLQEFEAFMFATKISAPLVYAIICQITSERLYDAFEEELERIAAEKNETDHVMDLQDKLEEMLLKFEEISSFGPSEKNWSPLSIEPVTLDMRKQYTQEEVDKLNHINEKTVAQKAKRSPGIRQKIQEIQSQLTRDEEQQDQTS